MAEVKLTELAAGGGCGCKLSAARLREIMQNVPLPPLAANTDGTLMVGWQTSDDAAVWRVADDMAIIATTDFFSPIVDDAFDFGRIAATNAISDVYAMGGTPLFALAICAMPHDVLSAETIAQILQGGQAACEGAGVVIAGGHSIASKEPIYGLAVVGRAHPQKIITNAGAQAGDVLLLSKPLGVGVYSAALKRGLLTAAEYDEMLAVMTQLNRAGAAVAGIDGCHAITDVTGFGLLGHLKEMCVAAGIGAKVEVAQLPHLASAKAYLQQGIVTGASARNWESVADVVVYADDVLPPQRDLLCDPQTSGGLLVACAANCVPAIQKVFVEYGQTATAIGLCTRRGNTISIIYN